MQREIKFRGQSINGEWHYGLLCHDRNKDSDYVWFISNSVGKPYAFGVIEKTIGQFTGLKDKKGKKIYDGDVVKGYFYCSSGEPFKGTYQVVWNQPWASFGVEIDARFVNIGNADIEIIGNVFGNPRLLQP